jgi:hypothetical protein
MGIFSFVSKSNQGIQEDSIYYDEDRMMAKNYSLPQKESY